MRIAVLSDIHGNLGALQAVAADFKKRGVDAVVNLGDSLSGPLLPLETAQHLMLQDWVHLAGNHERQVLQLSPSAGFADRYTHSVLGASEFDWLGSLNHTQTFSEHVLLCHGAPGADNVTLLQSAERPATSAEVEQRLGGHRVELIIRTWSSQGHPMRAMPSSSAAHPDGRQKCSPSPIPISKWPNWRGCAVASIGRGPC